MKIRLTKMSNIDLDYQAIKSTYIEAYFYAGRYKYHVDEDIDMLIQSIKDGALDKFKEFTLNNFSQRTATLIIKELSTNDNQIEVADHIYKLK